jgi:DNA-binding SARP family transcriptional activator/tetratricopeptide (TPR) repeat protein
MPNSIRIQALGTLDIRDERDESLQSICAQPKRAALLAFLAIEGLGGFVRRDKLFALFWPESSQSQARGALNQAVHFLRGALVADVLVSQGGEAIGVNRDLTWCDAIAFDDAVARGAHKEALGLYKAPFLEGFFLTGLTEFDQWADLQRQRRAAAAAGSAWSLAEEAASAGDAKRAVEYGRQAVAFAPEEAGTRRLILLLDRVGDRVGALRQYEQFAQEMREEYDAEPSPETQAVIAAVRARATPNASAAVMTTPSAPVSAVASPGPAMGASAERVTALRSASRWRRLAIGVAAVAILAVAATLWASRSALSGAPIATGRRVAVFPFAYRGGRDLGYLGEGVANLLASNISTGELQTVDPRALGAAVARDSGATLTLTRAARFAAGFDAGLFVIGDVTESGGMLRVDATLHDRTGLAADVKARAEGSPKDLFALVDQLTRELMKSRAEAGPGDLYRSASLTTHSVEALRAYVDGQQAMRSGQYEIATQAFRRAIGLDSSFALAYYGLGTATNWTGESTLSGWAAERAVTHGERLSGRDRRRVEAFAAYRRGEIGHADSLYASVVAESPTDVEALYHHADIKFHWGATFGTPLAETWPEWEQLVRLDPQNAGVLLHAARVAASRRNRVGFDSLSRRLNRLGTDAARSAELHALDAFAFGDRAARVAAAKEVQFIPEAVRRGIFQVTAATSRELHDVTELLAPLLFVDHTFMSFEDGQMLVVAQIEWARGRLASARARVDSVTILRPRRAREFRALFSLMPNTDANDAERRAALAALDAPLAPTELLRQGEPLRLYLRGFLSVRLGDTVTALKHAAALDRFRSREDMTGEYSQRLARLIRLEILRSAGKPAEALALLGKPQIPADKRLPHAWSYPQAHERFLRAQMLEAAGRNEEALRWYATFPDPNAYDFMFLPGALQRRAELLEKMGRKGEAVAAYERLLRLWQNADAVLQPIAQGARNRADALR